MKLMVVPILFLALFGLNVWADDRLGWLRTASKLAGSPGIETIVQNANFDKDGPLSLLFRKKRQMFGGRGDQMNGGGDMGGGGMNGGINGQQMGDGWGGQNGGQQGGPQDGMQDIRCKRQMFGKCGQILSGDARGQPPQTNFMNEEQTFLQQTQRNGNSYLDPQYNRKFNQEIVYKNTDPVIGRKFEPMPTIRENEGMFANRQRSNGQLGSSYDRNPLFGGSDDSRRPSGDSGYGSDCGVGKRKKRGACGPSGGASEQPGLFSRTWGAFSRGFGGFWKGFTGGGHGARGGRGREVGRG